MYPLSRLLTLGALAAIAGPVPSLSLSDQAASSVALSQNAAQGQPSPHTVLDVQRSVFAECNVGKISDLAFGRIRFHQPESLIVAGSAGYVAFDMDTGEERFSGKLDNPIPKAPLMPVRILDVDGNGLLDFIRIGGSWLGKTSRHTAEGKVLWSHPDDLVVSDTVALDIDGDNDVEFLMTFNATPQVHLVDHNGNLLWARDFGGVVSILPAAVQQGATRAMVYVNGDALWARDGEGNVLAKTVPPGGGFVNAIELVTGAPGAPSPCLLVGNYSADSYGQKYHLYALDAETHLRSLQREEVAGFIGAELLEIAEDKQFWLTTNNTKHWGEDGEFLGRAIGVRIVDESGRLSHADTRPLPRHASLAPAARLTSASPSGNRVFVGVGDAVFEYAVESRTAPGRVPLPPPDIERAPPALPALEKRASDALVLPFTHRVQVVFDRQTCGLFKLWDSDQLDWKLRDRGDVLAEGVSGVPWEATVDGDREFLKPTFRDARPQGDDWVIRYDLAMNSGTVLKVEETWRVVVGPRIREHQYGWLSGQYLYDELGDKAFIIIREFDVSGIPKNVSLHLRWERTLQALTAEVGFVPSRDAQRRTLYLQPGEVAGQHTLLTFEEEHADEERHAETHQIVLPPEAMPPASPRPR